MGEGRGTRNTNRDSRGRAGAPGTAPDAIRQRCAARDSGAVRKPLCWPCLRTGRSRLRREAGTALQTESAPRDPRRRGFDDHSLRCRCRRTSSAPLVHRATGWLFDGDMVIANKNDCQLRSSPFRTLIRAGWCARLSNFPIARRIPASPEAAALVNHSAAASAAPCSASSTA